MSTVVTRLLGYVVFPIVVAIVSWQLCAALFGENSFSQAITVIGTGLALSCWDLGYRTTRRSSSILLAIFFAEVPTVYYAPFWVLGLFVAGCGIAIMMNRS